VSTDLHAPLESGEISSPRSGVFNAKRAGAQALRVGEGLLLLAFVRVVVAPAFGSAALPAAVRAWLVVFLAVVIQALPFLVLGAVVSVAISKLATPRVVERLVPRSGVRAVPAAALASMLLPGCECASVPVSSSMMRHGVPRAAALTFLLAAPAVNPVVLVATAVAFPGHPQMVLARFAAAMLSAVTMGWLWLRTGTRWLPQPTILTSSHSHDAGLLATLRHDFLPACGYLIIGAALAATVNVALPHSIFSRLSGFVVVLALALLAVLIAVCSEADAFVAASLTPHPLAQLAFMVVGPMVDLKLITTQVGSFGSRFAAFFAPTTFVVGLGAALLVGSVLL